MIRLHNVEKCYETGVVKTYVLRRVSIEIKGGEFVSIMGPSGAGKSTLLHMIGMHDSAWTGEYYFLDHPVHKMNTRDRADLRNRNIGCDVLDRFQIVGKKGLYPHQLSGGQQQLVGIARAVVANPKLILADEPTGNLHSDQGREIMDMFKKLNDGGTTIIQVTHSEENASYGSRIINLRDGWVVQ